MGGCIALALAVVLLSSACSDGPPPQGEEGSSELPVEGSSSSLAWWDSDTLLLTSPDERSLLAVSATDLQVTRRWPLDSEVEHVVVAGPDHAIVSSLDRPHLHIVRPDGGGDGEARTLPLPCSRTRGLAVIPGTPPALDVWAACPLEARVVRLRFPGGLEEPADAPEVIPLPGRPSLLLRDGRGLLVADEREAAVHRIEPSRPEPVPEDLAVASLREGLPAEAAVAFLPVEGLVRTASGPLLLGTRLQHDRGRDAAPIAGIYGSVLDGSPRIEPWLIGAACAGGWARFDGAEDVYSGASAMAPDPQGRGIWIAHRGTRNLALVGCADGRPQVLERHAIGAGARAVLVAPEGSRLWVDLAFDHALFELDLLAGDTRTLRRPAQIALTRDEERGRRIFFDALDTQLTPSGVVACASCHPGAEDDGLVWFLNASEADRRAVRTTPAWTVRAELAPFHRDGSVPEAQGLVRDTIRSLMGGAGLLVDTRAVVAWLASLNPAPPAPIADAADEARIRRGEQLFHGEGGCAACHAGSLFSDGELHSVTPPSRDPDARVVRALTPTLLGVRTRGPWLHDGRARTLHAIWREHDPEGRHGAGTGLDDDDLDALVRYLQNL